MADSRIELARKALEKLRRKEEETRARAGTGLVHDAYTPGLEPPEWKRAREAEASRIEADRGNLAINPGPRAGLVHDSNTDPTLDIHPGVPKQYDRADKPFRPGVGNLAIDLYDRAFGEAPVRQPVSFQRDTPEDQAAIAAANKPSTPTVPRVGGGVAMPKIQSGEERYDQTLKEGYDQIGKGQQALTNLAAEKAMTEAEGVDEALHQDAIREGEIFNRSRAREAATEQRVKQWDRAIEDAAANSDIQSGYAKLDTGSKIMAALAVGLGAVSQVYTHGENPGLTVLNKAFEQDLDAAKARFMAKDRVADNRGQLVQQVRLNAKDQDGADLLHRQYLLSNTLGLLDAKLKGISSQEILARGEQMKGALHLEIAKVKEGLRGVALSEAASAMAAASRGAGGAGVPGKHTDENTRWLAGKMQEAGIPQAEYAIDEAIAATNAPGGDKGIGPIASRLAQGRIAGDKPEGILGSLANEFGQEAHRSIYGDAASIAEQKYQAAENAIMKSLSGSGVSGPEQERIQRQMRGARTPEARRVALQSAYKSIQAAKENLRGGINPNDAKIYDQNRQQNNPNTKLTTEK